ncbi:3'-5' exonuclease [Pectinatus sottacetonis]|uniref:3'-5' exonuclease n=1 Tax=Pectinatus sottacetonis TaxID=1002795 RepID=UPI001E43B53A|nr:3'-5' exonuclease [Pectinatus sottacetonis]
MENKIFNMLNKMQKQVVNDLQNNILLSASAGTGKTNTLLYRMVNIIDKNKAAPEEILCLTFTNKACHEIQERAATVLGENSLNIAIMTFHSFCYNLIKIEAKKNSDLFADFVIFDEDDCAEIIKEFNVYKFVTKSLQNFINLVKENRAVYNIYSNNLHTDYARVIKKLFNSENRKLDRVCVNQHYFLDKKMKALMQANGADIVTAYDHRLQEMHGLDFTDLIITVYKFLQDETIKTAWQNKYKYINIDEMQDTSELEYEILAQIFPGNNILLCGDYFQTIYEWRGSNPHTILKKFKAKYNPRLIVFNENYRATQMLLRASYGCLKKLFGEKVYAIYKNEIKAVSRVQGEKIIFKETKNVADEAKWIFEEIHKIGIKDVARIGILTRSNKYNQRLSKNFSILNNRLPNADRVNFILVDEFKFFRRQEIKDVLAFLRLITNRYDETSFRRILKKFAIGIGEKTIAAIETKKYHKAGINIIDFLDRKTYESSGDPFGILLDALAKDKVVVFDVESTGTDTACDEIIQIAAVKIDKNGTIIDKFVRMVKPNKKVGQSFYVHGFSDAFLKEKGEPPALVLQEFIEFSRNTVIVGHNVGYDISILYSQLDRLNMNKPDFITYYDTLDIFRRFYPDLANHKLSFLSEYFVIENKPTHNALDDVMATVGLLLYAVKKNIGPSVLIRKKYISKYIDQFRWIAVQMQELTDNSYIVRPYDLIAKIMNLTKIKEYYKNEPERIDRIRELYLIAREIDNKKVYSRDALNNLLKISALSNSDMDRMLMKVPRIPIITVHQAKGTEFDYVFLAGMQDGIFPAYLAIREGVVEEEKRLFYVAITRAKRQLFLTWSRISEHGRANTVSRFIKTIPVDFVQKI